MNEEFGKDFYRIGTSVKRSGPFSELPESETEKLLFSSSSRKSALEPCYLQNVRSWSWKESRQEIITPPFPPISDQERFQGGGWGFLLCEHSRCRNCALPPFSFVHPPTP